MSKYLFSYRFALNGAMHILLNDDKELHLRNTYIKPPDSNVLIDEHSGDKDVGGLVDNLNGNRIRA